MCSRKKPIQFDPTQYYILSEAFFRVGLAMFPHTWSGHEQFAAPVEGVEEFKAFKAKLENDRERYVSKARVLASLDDDGLSQTEFDAQIFDQRHMAEKAAAVRDELHRIRGRYESHYEDDKTWQRRVTVEDRLRGAFANEELTLTCGASAIVTWDSWCREKDFIVSFTFSLIYAPRRMLSRRKNSAFVKKDNFDFWYAVQSDFSDDGQQKTEEQRVEAFITALVQSNQAGMTREDLVTRLRKEFPSLSERAAYRYRTKFVPDEWTHAGRKSKS